MKVYQPTLSVGVGGNVLIDATNKILNETGKFKESRLKKRKSNYNLENHRPSKTIRKDGIFVDETLNTKSIKLDVPSTNKIYIDKGIQTESIILENKEDLVQKTIEMLTSEKPTYEYLERLAAKRGQQLNISLEKIESLEGDNEVLREENKILKEDVKLMEEMVEEAKGIALAVQNLTGLQVLPEREESEDADSDSGTSESEEKL